MSIAGDLSRAAQARGRGRAIERALSELPAEAAQALRDALASHAQHTTIAEILTKHGYPCSESSVRRYRRAMRREDV